MNSSIRRKSWLIAVLAVTCTSVALAQTPKPAASGKAAITVTAIGKKDAAPPSVSKDDVQLTVNKERKQVAGWSKDAPLALAILIDDSLDTSAASQWNELKDFILAQPANAAVAVAYAANSRAVIAQDFTTDHELAAKALRIPRGDLSGSSPYLAVIDWLKRWPSAGGRRSLLLISSGIDYFRSNFGPIYPDVDTAIANAQRSNVILWSIYSPGAGHRSRSFFRANTGQNNLSKMTEETGGETYYLGTSAPVSFRALLDEIQNHLSNQYLLTFAGDGGEKGKLVKVQLKTELAGVELSHANNAYIAGSR